MRRMKRTVLTGVAALLAVSANVLSGPILAGVAEDALWFAQVDLLTLRQTVVGQRCIAFCTAGRGALRTLKI